MMYLCYKVQFLSVLLVPYLKRVIFRMVLLYTVLSLHFKGTKLAHLLFLKYILNLFIALKT